jgi:hypothetical protein
MPSSDRQGRERSAIPFEFFVMFADCYTFKIAPMRYFLLLFCLFMSLTAFTGSGSTSTNDSSTICAEPVDVYDIVFYRVGSGECGRETYNSGKSNFVICDDMIELTSGDHTTLQNMQTVNLWTAGSQYNIYLQ